MDENSGPKVDLLGDPWTPPRDPRGRKRHKRCPKVAETVALLASRHTPVVDIALRVQLSEPTLRKYYFRELEKGGAIIQALMLERMYRRAQDGVVGAARWVQEQLDKAALQDASRSYGHRQPAEGRAAKPEVIGKKEQRQRAAEEVAEGGSLFRPPPPPKAH